jgi:hypothetical protein
MYISPIGSENTAPGTPETVSLCLTRASAPLNWLAVPVSSVVAGAYASVGKVMLTMAESDGCQNVPQPVDRPMRTAAMAASMHLPDAALKSVRWHTLISAALVEETV